MTRSKTTLNKSVSVAMVYWVTLLSMALNFDWINATVSSLVVPLNSG